MLNNLRWRGGFRRRLAVLFATTVAVSGLLLAIGSYFLARYSALDAVKDRDLEELEVDVQVVGRAISDSGASRHELGRISRMLRSRGRVEAVVVLGRRWAASQRGFSPANVPPELTSPDRNAKAGYSHTVVGKVPYGVAAHSFPGAHAALYLFFSERDLYLHLAQLRDSLAIAWVVVVVLAAMSSRVAAGWTLRPVRSASRAAQAIAEGRLDIRLNVAGSDEIATLTRSFNQMASALEHRIEDLVNTATQERHLTADLAHELRTPLTALLAETSLLVDGLPQGSKEQRLASRIAASVRRVRGLIEDLLEVFSLSAGATGVHLEQFDLAAALSAVIEDRGWQNRVVLDATGAEVESDLRRIDRIATNLIDNALTHGGSNVRVSVRAMDAIACLEVADDGPGIPPSALKHIYERFYKADGARGGGSGLGLAIAYESALLVGGRLEVESEIGRGTIFRLTLPTRLNQP